MFSSSQQLLRCTVFSFVFAALVSACAGRDTSAAGRAEANPVQVPLSSEASQGAKLRTGLSSAVLTPLDDLNLRKAQIPDPLANLDSPYDPVVDVSCETLGEMVLALDEHLGRDDDYPGAEKENGLVRNASDSATNYAVNAVGDAAGDLIPLRSIVRRVTGARRSEARIQASFDRGIRRRAYLKGIGFQMGCSPPAAPYPGVEAPGQGQNGENAQ